MAFTRCPNPECKRPNSLELVDLTESMMSGASRFRPGDMVARCRHCGAAVAVVLAREPKIDKILKIVEDLKRG